MLKLKSSYGHFIDGEELSIGNKVFETINPATEEVLAIVTEGDSDSVNRAVMSGESAFEHVWKNVSPYEKGAILRRIASRLRKEVDFFSNLITLESGRPITATKGEVEAVAQLFEYNATLPENARGFTVPTKSNLLNYSKREPYGVVAAIVPWNYPLINVATKVAPVLACGNSIVVKAAEQTPLPAYYLAKIAVEEGLPPGVFNVVHGGEHAGKALVAHKKIKKITFTGSSTVGEHIIANAGGVKSFTLELGGKTANVVFSDANLDAAVEGTAFTIFSNQGQTCTAGTRLIIHESIASSFLEKLAARVEKLRVGDPLDPQTQIGSVISKEQFKRIMRYIEIGKLEGANLYSGGAAIGEKGYFIAPTIFTDVTPDMRIANEEIFGPVLSVITFRTDDEALQIANSTDYGLASTFWTADLSKAHRLANQLESGIVWINTTNTLTPGSSYGGYKRSGVGVEEGLEAIQEYTQQKTIWIETEEFQSPFN